MHLKTRRSPGGFARRPAFILPASRKYGCDRCERLSTAAFPKRRRAFLVPAAKLAKDAVARMICGDREQGRWLGAGNSMGSPPGSALESAPSTSRPDELLHAHGPRAIRRACPVAQSDRSRNRSGRCSPGVTWRVSTRLSAAAKSCSGPRGRWASVGSWGAVSDADSSTAQTLVPDIDGLVPESCLPPRAAL